MPPNRYSLGLVGLGVMGRNLALNLSEHGFPVLGLDRDPEKAKAFETEGKAFSVGATTDAAALVKGLDAPRVILLLVPAGEAVDAVLADLLPRLSPGDLVIDGGNSHFKDTERRAAALEAKGLRYMGLGVSGGEAGARKGPSLMPGGDPKAFERVRPMLEAIAARAPADGAPCVAHLGPGGAGHFVKMVHNGIEYALMQLLAETYDIMKRSLGLSAPELRAVYENWNATASRSFLIEITASIFRLTDAKSGRPLVEMISDVARQKGTGKWTVSAALDLQVPVPSIEAAVTARELSRLGDERERAADLLVGPAPALRIESHGTEPVRSGHLSFADLVSLMNVG